MPVPPLESVHGLRSPKRLLAAHCLFSGLGVAATFAAGGSVMAIIVSLLAFVGTIVTVLASTGQLLSVDQ